MAEKKATYGRTFYSKAKGGWFRYRCPGASKTSGKAQRKLVKASAPKGGKGGRRAPAQYRKAKGVAGKPVARRPQSQMPKGGR